MGAEFYDFCVVVRSGKKSVMPYFIFVSCSTLHVGCNSRQLEKQSITWCEIGPFRCNAVVRRDRPYLELNKVHCIFELGHYAKIVQTFCELRT